METDVTDSHVRLKVNKVHSSKFKKTNQAQNTDNSCFE